MADEPTDTTRPVSRPSVLPDTQKGIHVPHLRWALTRARSATKLKYWAGLLGIVVAAVSAAVVPSLLGSEPPAPAPAVADPPASAMSTTAERPSISDAELEQRIVEELTPTSGPAPTATCTPGRFSEGDAVRCQIVRADGLAIEATAKISMRDGQIYVALDAERPTTLAAKPTDAPSTPRTTTPPASTSGVPTTATTSQSQNAGPTEVVDLDCSEVGAVIRGSRYQPAQLTDPEYAEKALQGFGSEAHIGRWSGSSCATVTSGEYLVFYGPFDSESDAWAYRRENFIRGASVISPRANKFDPVTGGLCQLISTGAKIPEMKAGESLDPKWIFEATDATTGIGGMAARGLSEMTPALAEAIRGYQGTHGLNRSGTFDPATIDELRKESGCPSVATDLPSAKSYGYIRDFDLGARTVQWDKVEFFRGSEAMDACITAAAKQADASKQVDNCRTYPPEFYISNGNPLLREARFDKNSTFEVLGNKADTVPADVAEFLTTVGGSNQRLVEFDIDEQGYISHAMMVYTP